MTDESIRVDLLVVGGGMAGLSAAAEAASSGAVVGVVEKGAELGGSAALSAGILWTARDFDDARADCRMATRSWDGTDPRGFEDAAAGCGRPAWR